MIISAKAILRPRKVYDCGACGEQIIGPHVRLYGAADEYDLPYVLRMHEPCVIELDPKIRAKVRAAAPEDT